MTTGTVKFFNPLAGFGFIKGDRDYFFHISQCPDNYKPRIGDELEFTPVNNKRGWAANAIEIIQTIETKEE